MRLRAVAAGGAARTVAIEGRVVIGRAAGTDLVLPGTRISRRHAAVEVRDGRLVVEDLGSRNGTWVGGTRLAGVMALAPDEAFRVGEWRVELEDEGVEAGRRGDTSGSRRPRWPYAIGATAAALLVIAWGRGGAPAEHGVDRESREEAGGEALALTETGADRGRSAMKAGEPFAAAPEADNEKRAAEEGVAVAAAPGTPVTLSRKTTDATLVSIQDDAGQTVGMSRGGMEASESRGAAARLGRWRAEVAGSRLVLEERLTAGDWPGARAAVARLDELDPLDVAVAAAVRTLAAEEPAAEREGRARELEAAGRDEEALALYREIPRSSWHHGRARDAAVRLMRERLGPAQREDCRRRLTGARRAEALPVCRRYLDLTCHEQSDEAVVAAVRRLERRRREAPWSCPVALADWLAAPAAGGVDPSVAVRARYGDGPIAGALLAHVRDGRTRPAREQLDRLAEARQGDGAAVAAEAGRLARQLEELDGRLVEARSRLLAGELDVAEGALTRAAAIEEALLPGGPPSIALGAGRGALGTALRERGEEHLARGRDGLAFTAFERALAFAPSDPAVRRGLERLEGRAAARLDDDSSCGAATVALSTTIAGGVTRRRAEERLAAPTCRGAGAF